MNNILPGEKVINDLYNLPCEGGCGRHGLKATTGILYAKWPFTVFLNQCVCVRNSSPIKWAVTVAIFSQMDINSTDSRQVVEALRERREGERE